MQPPLDLCKYFDNKLNHGINGLQLTSELANQILP